MKQFFVSVLIVTVVAAVVTLAGCAKMNMDDGGLAPGRGTTRSLGDTSYQQAFAAARQVMAQYYSIASANVNTGLISCKPKLTQAKHERLLGGSPSRQVATMEISQKNGAVVAQVLVLQQRQGAAARERMGYSSERYNYSGRPGDETPADLDAATTAKQNQAWETEKPLHHVEIKILDDLYKSLHR